MFESQDVAQFVLDDCEEINAILLTLIAGQQKFTVVQRGLIDEPAPTGGVVVEPNRIARCEAQRCATEIRDADVDVLQSGGINSAGLKATHRSRKHRTRLLSRQHRCIGIIAQRGGTQVRFSIKAKTSGRDRSIGSDCGNPR